MSAPDRRYPPFAGPPPGFDTDPGDDYRARAQAELAATASRRQQDLAEQRSAAKAPFERIRIWERLHMTRLPPEPDHSLVPVVAAGTGLAVADVQAEQRERALRAGAAATAGRVGVSPSPG